MDVKWWTRVQMNCFSAGKRWQRGKMWFLSSIRCRNTETGCACTGFGYWFCCLTWVTLPNNSQIYLACSRLTRLCPARKMCSLSPIITLLLSKFFRSRWLDFVLVLFFWHVNGSTPSRSITGQYSPVRLDLARLVSSLLYGTRTMLVLSLPAFENKKYTA